MNERGQGMLVTAEQMLVRKARRLARAGVLIGTYLVAAACGGKPAAHAGGASANGSQRAQADAGAAQTSGRARRTVLFVGTSLTAGLGLDPDSAFPQLIQAKIDSARLPFDVVNAGVSGETTAGLLRRLEWLLRADFDVLVLETGANDGLRGTPVATARRNIRQVIDSVRSNHPAARLLLVQMEAPPNLGRQYTADFREMYPEIARETGVTLMPFLLDRVAGVTALNQGDGMHPNVRGERIVADNVWRSLMPVLAQLDSLPRSP
jgi:acyl-CoA thioesterase I